jgi:tungstate transport system permease protein
MSLGAAMAIFRFPGRGALLIFTNAMMGLPPVVVGLAIYMLLSNAGPLGAFSLLYSPTAMVIAQTVLVTPIATALTRQVISDLHVEYDEQLRSLSLGPLDTLGTLLWDARFSLITVALAGFGRAIAEVGAVIIVGGNINHVTRVMTTAIALETSKGDLALALALGLILIGISITVNAALMALKGTARRFAYE